MANLTILTQISVSLELLFISRGFLTLRKISGPVVQWIERKFPKL